MSNIETVLSFVPAVMQPKFLDAMLAAINDDHINKESITAKLFEIDPLYHNVFMGDQEKASIIIQTICEFYKIKPDELKVETRKQEICYARQLAMQAIYQCTGLSLYSSGKLFARDHSTVLHAKKAICDYYETNKNKRAEIKKIIEQLAEKNIKGLETIFQNDKGATI